ncbi:hypothetical protein TCAL_16649 [Tigriopus californicus]|uniref:NHR domain-containing protein n=1 Tax=Tigriopus californicus TaxID=6832 RepID=A0A553NDU5_TIGCA|nr:hypothetical protein TCAL_16649 [Tigriopus californicus]
MASSCSPWTSKASAKVTAFKANSLRLPARNNWALSWRSCRQSWNHLVFFDAIVASFLRRLMIDSSPFRELRFNHEAGVKGSAFSLYGQEVAVSRQPKEHYFDDVVTVQAYPTHEGKSVE